MPRLIELTGPDSPAARQAFAIYEASFPADERHPVDYFEGLLAEGLAGRPQDGRIWHFHAALEDAMAAGLTMYEYYRAPRLGYLFYMAVAPDQRGRGLGGWLFRQTLDRLAEDARRLAGPPPLGLFWEVERPQDAVDQAEREMRERRIAFYLRSGGVLLEGVDFTAPPVGPGLAEVPFYLMFCPVEGGSARVSDDLARLIIETMLLEGYGVGRESEYYHRALASLAERRRGSAGTGL